MNKNPYAISFGRIPTQYISRDVIIDEITTTFNSDVVDEQAFKITGIRGTGKTVTLTAIEKALAEEKDWIIVDLKPGADITNDLIAKLYTDVPFITDFIDVNLNLTAFGIGISLSKKSPVASLDVALEKILAELEKRNKRILVVIDEARKTDALVDFIQEFQILIRRNLPIFLIIAGLYEDIESIENTDGLTFFLRATKYEMTPLNIGVIREDYKQTLGLSDDVAYELAVLTKGYAFAYQAFGKYMWDEKCKTITPLVLAKVDDVLAQKVYDKIWSELTPKDQWYVRFIAEKDAMDAAELLEITKKSHSDWSEPRKRLIEKGVIDGSIRGKIVLKLPRFREYIANRDIWQ